MLKLADNPPLLSPLLADVSTTADRWWVAHTRARFEKAFAWELVRREVPYFLPMVERVRFSGGRKRRTMMPLFPGYAFFAGDQETRYHAMCTGRLCQAIEATDQDRLVRELHALHLALEGGAELELHIGPAVGQRCRVTDGPFMGVEGVVVDRGRHARLALQVHMLADAAVLEVEADLLEPLED